MPVGVLVIVLIVVAIPVTALVASASRVGVDGVTCTPGERDGTTGVDTGVGSS